VESWPRILLRPLWILACFVLGFMALDRIVIRGSVFDPSTPSRWSDDGIDIISAREAMRRADFAQAGVILKELIAREPNHGEAHQLLGRLYLQKGQPDLALQHYKTARTYLPGDKESERAVEMLTARSFAQDAAHEPPPADAVRQSSETMNTNLQSEAPGSSGSR